MANKWFALYREDDGRLVSVGTVVAERLPDGVSVLEIKAQPDSLVMWDETTRALISRPPTPPELLQQLKDEQLARDSIEEEEARQARETKRQQQNTGESEHAQDEGFE